MKNLDEFRESKLSRALLGELERAATKPFRVMEVCGTHTMAVFRLGLRSVLPDAIQLVSGPGCPVCVTSAAHMDAFIDLALQDNTRLVIFGDLFRVPGTRGKGTLADASSKGANVNIVYSPLDALTLAREHPEQQVVFAGVGFETTTPAVAATVMAAKMEKIDNFSVFSTQKVMIPPLIALFDDPELMIDGLLCPGHVSSIIGADAYKELVKQYHLPCVVGGFEGTDILQALILMARQVSSGRAEVENAYIRAVKNEGNKRAMHLVAEIFEPVDMEWRGLGVLPGSGLAFRDSYAEFDAGKRFDIRLSEASQEPAGCLCGNILKGKNVPPDCPLFGKGCDPSDPVGPCMVSSEGTCAAYYKYGS